MRKADQITDEIRGTCRLMCAAAPSRLRIAKNEQDTSEDAQPEADEFLKLGGIRLGRDFKVYGFMAEVSGSGGQAFADFASVAMAVKNNIPEAFEAARGNIEGWAEYFDEDTQPDWLALWAAEADA